MRAFAFVAVSLALAALFVPIASATVTVHDEALCNLLPSKEVPLPSDGVHAPHTGTQPADSLINALNDASDTLESAHVDLTMLRETCKRNSPIAVTGFSMPAPIDLGVIVLS